MSILLEHEFNILEKELKSIKGLIGKEDNQKLLLRSQKILDRLDESKKARIKRANLRLVS